MATGDVIYAHGFEGGDPAKDNLSLITTGGTVTETATNKRTGDYCLRVNRTSNAAVRAVNSGAVVSSAFPDRTKSNWGVHFSLYVASLPTGATHITIAYFTVPNGNDCEVRLNSSGELICGFYSGTGVSTGFSVAPTALAAGNRYRIEVAIDIVASGGNARCKVRVNGDAGGSEMTQGAPAAGSFIEGVQFGSYESANASTYDLYFDDVVVTEGYAYPGDFAVAVLRPDTAAADLDTNWTITGGDTKRAQAIDETPPDDVTTYITSSTSGQTQRIPMTDVTVSGTIKGVAAFVRTGSNSTTGTRLFNTTLRSSGGTDGTAVSTNYDVNGWANGDCHKVFLSVPGGTGWTQTDLDGIQLKFTKDANTNAVRVTQAYLAVAYVPSLVQTVSGAGAIATAQVFGTAVVSRGARAISGAGAIATAQAFGTAVVSRGAVSVTGAGAIASAQAFGTAVVSRGARAITGAGAIASAQAFGTATVLRGARAITGAGAIASAQAFGTAQVNRDVKPTGIASAQAFGTATVTATKTLSPTGIASAQAFGTASISRNIKPTGIASAEAFGTTSVFRGSISPTGIPSAQAFGNPTVLRGAVTVSGAGAIASAQAFGSTTVRRATFFESIMARLPLLFWRLGESSGNPQDSSGNALHATGTGSGLGYNQTGLIKNDADGSLKTTTTSGVSSASRNGLGASPPTQAVTVRTTIKWPVGATPTNWPNFVNYGWVGVLRWLLYESSTNVIWGISDSGGNQRNAASSTYLPRDDRPHHLVATADLTTGDSKLYIDGVLVASINSPSLVGQTFTATAATFGIGYSTATGGVFTQDEVAVFKSVWSQADVTNDYSQAWDGWGILPTGIASAEAFGTAAISRNVKPTGIPSAQAFGTASISRNVKPTGIPTAQAFGNPTVNRGAVSVTGAGAIPSTEAFGGAVVLRNAKLISPTAIASAEAFGTASVLRGAVSVTGTGAIPSAQAFGLARIVLYAKPTGIPSAQAFGTAAISRNIKLTGIASAEAFGTAAISRNVKPTGIASAEAFGVAALSRNIKPTGIPSAQAFGLARIVLYAKPTGIASAEAFGVAVVLRGTVFAHPGGIPSQEAFGVAVVLRGAVSVSGVGAIPSDESFGLPFIKFRQLVFPIGIPSDEVVGQPGVGTKLIITEYDLVVSHSEVRRLRVDYEVLWTLRLTGWKDEAIGGLITRTSVIYTVHERRPTVVVLRDDIERRFSVR